MNKILKRATKKLWNILRRFKTIISDTSLFFELNKCLKFSSNHKNINLDEVYLINKLSIYNLSVRNFGLVIFMIREEEHSGAPWWRTVFLQNNGIKRSFFQLNLINSTKNNIQNLENKNEDF